MTRFDPSENVKKAVEAYESALKMGTKVQEESLKLFTEAVQTAGSPQEWPTRSKKALENTIQWATKMMDDTVGLMNANTKQSMDLLKKVFEAGQSTSITEAQAKTTEIWESTLSVLRENTQTLVHANARAVDALSALMKSETGTPRTTTKK
jgi:hypothetical protein